MDHQNEEWGPSLDLTRSYPTMEPSGSTFRGSVYLSDGKRAQRGQKRAELYWLYELYSCV